MSDRQNGFENTEENVKVFANHVMDRILDMQNGDKLKDNKITSLEKRISDLEDKVALLEGTGKTNEPEPVPPDMPSHPKAPKNITFVTGHSYKVEYWFDIVPETIKYLIMIDKFVLSEKIKNFVNATPYTKNGSRYQHVQQVNEYYINKYATVDQLKNRVKLLLKSCGVDPNSISYIEKENKQTISDSPPTIHVMPSKMIFPDGKKYPIKHWNDIIMSTAVHLINAEKLIITEEIKDFINVEQYTRRGHEYIEHRQLDNYYINVHGASWQHQNRADSLMKTHNIDPNSIIYETLNGEKYIKPTRSSIVKPPKKKTKIRKNKSVQTPPIKMIFPTGEIYEIKKWNMLVQSTVKHLVDSSKFTLREEFKSYVNTEPKRASGKDYILSKQIDGYYVELLGSAKTHQSQVDKILSMHGIDPESIKYEY